MLYSLLIEFLVGADAQRWEQCATLLYSEISWNRMEIQVQIPFFCRHSFFAVTNMLFCATDGRVSLRLITRRRKRFGFYKRVPCISTLCEMFCVKICHFQYPDLVFVFQNNHNSRDIWQADAKRKTKAQPAGRAYCDEECDSVTCLHSSCSTGAVWSSWSTGAPNLRRISFWW